MKKFEGKKLEFGGQRLDKFLADKLEEVSRSQVQKMIENGDVLINDIAKKSSYVLVNQDVIVIKKVIKKVPKKPKAEKFDLPVLYEDKDVLVVDKPYGMVVHPVSDGQYMEGTVVNAVLSKLKPKDFDGLRPGIVHRIDKDTSGALIVAKNEKAFKNLVEQFKERKIEKYYLVLVNGLLQHLEGVIDAPIGRGDVNRKKMHVTSDKEGKSAISLYKVLESFKVQSGKYIVSLLQVQIKTGRTHQIRVHMAAIGHPVIGDAVYGSRKLNMYFERRFGLTRQFLHAHKLKFVSPSGKNVEVTAKIPNDMEMMLEKLKREK